MGDKYRLLVTYDVTAAKEFMVEGKGGKTDN